MSFLVPKISESPSLEYEMYNGTQNITIPKSRHCRSSGNRQFLTRVDISGSVEHRPCSSLFVDSHPWKV